MPECSENGTGAPQSNLENGEVFLFTSESVGEGHPGRFWAKTLKLLCKSWKLKKEHAS